MDEDCGCGSWDGGYDGACGNCGQIPYNPFGALLLLSGGSLEPLLLDCEEEEAE
jgi:hypothetical protein